METFSVPTTDPTDLFADLLANLHHRMPALLDPDEAWAWLESPDLDLPASLHG